MDKELLSILVCPRSKKKLTTAPEKIIQKINELIEKGTCTDLGGASVKEPIQSALFESQSKLVYPVINGIPLLIYENAIQLQNS